MFSKFRLCIYLKAILLFILYADVLISSCNSVHKWESIIEIHNDAHTFGLKSSNSSAVSNSNLAISWLEATFPDLTHQASEGIDLSAIRARPYALFDASLSLQVHILSSPLPLSLFGNILSYPIYMYVVVVTFCNLQNFKVRKLTILERT